MRILTLTGKCLLAAALAILTAELCLRVAGSLMSGSRGDEDLGDGHIVVLCVGDSHTWGRGKGYPLRLSERLGERSSRYRVVNLGVPGTNTAQLRTRFLGYLERYRPRVVILWSGINNYYNRADSHVWEEVGVARASPGRRLLDASRVLRFFRVWRNQIELNRHMTDRGIYVVPETGPRHRGEHLRRQLIGEDDVFRSLRGDELPPEEAVRVTELDVRWLITQARERDVPLVAVTYGLPGVWPASAHQGILAAARETGAILVDSSDAATRLRDRYRAQGRKVPELYDDSAHPTQEFYREIGDLILEALDAHELLPDLGPGHRPAEEDPALGDEHGISWWIAQTTPPDGRMGRFLESADRCQPTEVTTEIRSSALGLGWISAYHLAIGGVSGGECVLRFRLEQVMADADDPLLDPELSQDRRDAMASAYAEFRARLEGTVGRTGTCRFLVRQARATLALWHAGKTLLSRHAECEGPLFEDPA